MPTNLGLTPTHLGSSEHMRKTKGENALTKREGVDKYDQGDGTVGKIERYVVDECAGSAMWVDGEEREGNVEYREERNAMKRCRRKGES